MNKNNTNAFIFIIISLASGVMAGEILAIIDYFVVEPTTDKAIGYETQSILINCTIIEFGKNLG